MKVGMLTLFDKWGVRYATTVLQLDSCEVVQVKTKENDGYVALQLGVGEAKATRVKLSQLKHFQKASVKPKRVLAEFRVSEDCILPIGSKLSAAHFVPGQLVDVQGAQSVCNIRRLLIVFTLRYK